ncbi:MAG: COR domain-containing protein [Marinifilaceae bacterium]
MTEQLSKIIEEEKLNKTGTLSLGVCNLSEFPKEIFELIWLEELSFERKRNQKNPSVLRIDRLPTEFKKLTKLRKLSLGGVDSNLRIQDISILGELKLLEEINLSSNAISSIKVLEELPNLISLNVKDTLINQIDEIRSFTNLHELRVNKLDVADFDFFANFKSLTSLEIGESKITDISFLRYLANLTSLSLQNNNISNIEKISNLKGLHELDLSKNNISDISCLKMSVNLTSLALHNNEISDISALRNLASLISLLISYNKITEINVLEEIKNLNVIDLSYNNICKLNALKSHKKLILLLADNNNITDLRELASFSKLVAISLNDNAIEDISVLKNLSKLKIANLSNNNISNIDSFVDLTYMMNLGLSNNKIEDISPLKLMLSSGLTIGDEKSNINIENNPLVYPPISIVEEGREAILNWFELTSNQEVEKLYEAKLIIVGEPGAGKTTLQRKLINNDYSVDSKEANELQSTLGINIYENWSFPLICDESISFNTNIWDFGGQEIQYMTHQFFLTPSALYVLVADDRKQQTNFPYWFETIDLLGKEGSYQSPLLVVLNENKHQSITNFDYSLYKKRYDNTHIEQIEVDLSKSDTRLTILKSKIQESLCKLKHVGEEVPKQWKLIRDELKKRATKTNNITEQEYITICKSYGIIDLPQQLLISRYLHKLGRILHFQADDFLNDFIILNPQWAVDAVYSILENSDIAKNGGRFSKSDIKKIWTKYSTRDQNNLLCLMKKDAFEICYEINKDEYIAAQLLSTIKPVFEFNKSNILRFRYQYAFMPKGLITRFIVRFNEYILDDNDGVPLVWNKGVVISKDDCKARIIEDDLNKEGLKVIDIEVTGDIDEKKYLLRMIREGIESIHKKWFKTIKCEPMVPCICEDCVSSDSPTLFGYSTLEKYRNQKIAVINCDKGVIKPVNVLSLLEGVYSNEEIFSKSDIMKKEIEENILKNITINISPNISPNLSSVISPVIKTVTSSESTASSSINVDFSNLLGDTDNLKEDIRRELKIKKVKEEDIEYAVSDVECFEGALKDAQSSINEDKPVSPKSRSRISGFMDDLKDKDSSVSNMLSKLRKGKDYSVKLAKGYNSIAENIGLPLVPKLLLDVAEKV